MLMKMTKYILGLSLLALSVNLFAQTSISTSIPANMIVGVTIQDLHRAPMAVPLPRWKVAKLILPGLLKEIYGGRDIDPYPNQNDDDNVTPTPVYIAEMPTETSTDVVYHLLTVVRFDTGGTSFTSVDGDNDVEGYRDVQLFKFDMVVSKTNESGFLNNVRQLTYSNLKGEVSLVERKLILTDEQLKLKMVLPIGVGAFDLGVMNQGKNSILTPRFKSAFLTAKATLSRRNRPKYYDGKPFIRLVDGVTGKDTEIGFHKDVNGEFVRGFDSHGCMRLRLEDLYMLHDLVKYVQLQIPLTVSYRINDTADHPEAKRNQLYKQVKNVGTYDNPQVDLDIDDLTALEYIEGQPPVIKLADDPNDHFENMYIYSGMDSYEKQQAQHEKDCREQHKYDSDPDQGTETCMKQFKRNIGVGDFLHRWWTM